MLPPPGLKTRAAAISTPSLRVRRIALRSLLVPERFNGIEIRRLPCRINPENQADSARNAERKNAPKHRHGRWHRGEDQADETGYEAAEQDADHAPNRGKHDSFERELQQDILSARADRFANPDFARPFGYGNQHDVHYAHARHH